MVIDNVEILKEESKEYKEVTEKYKSALKLGLDYNIYYLDRVNSEIIKRCEIDNPEKSKTILRGIMRWWEVSGNHIDEINARQDEHENKTVQQSKVLNQLSEALNKK